VIGCAPGLNFALDLVDAAIETADVFRRLLRRPLWRYRPW